jgi:acetylornithine deacetylase/succinyl-diaminopimelate desuccinylase family protein
MKGNSELTPQETRVLEQINPSETITMLKEVVRLRSDYPPGDCRLAIQFIHDQFEQAGISCEILSRNEQQPNLIARLGDPLRRPVLLYHAHIDTVPAGEMERWSYDPFDGKFQDGKIYGRGAGDDKSSVVAQVAAMLALKRAEVEFEGCLEVAIVADEESGGLQGTKWLHDQKKLTADALVVGEQTKNHIAIAERVACGIDLTVFGKSAHGAMPWAGENAVLKAAGALNWLKERLFPVLEARRHPYLPPPTLNVGKIQGGIQWSIVPERCKIEMDRRLIPGETREQAMEEIRTSLNEYSLQVEPLNFELFSSGEVAANINTPPEHPFVCLSHQALIDLTAEDRPLTGYVQTSDGRWFARDGIPIILFGPSDPAVAHATNEYVTTDQLLEAARFFTLLGMRYLHAFSE